MNASVNMLLILGALGATLALDARHHADHAPHHGHAHHTHTHSHDGTVHTHGHTHTAHDDHAEDGPGVDHHGTDDGHDDPTTPGVLRTSLRDARRADMLPPNEVPLATADALERTPHAQDLPERPPRPPTRPDALTHLRTIILLT